MVLALALISVVSGVLPANQCTSEERQEWSGNETFSSELETCMYEVMIMDTERLVSSLHTLFPEISERCLGCLNRAAECTRMFCLRECIGGVDNPGCQHCLDLVCAQPLLTCTGAYDASELPNLFSVNPPSGM